MQDIVLYCKSYRQDLLRAKRLVQSIRQYNSGGIPFYLSCPSVEVSLFRDTIGSEDVIFLSDEEIVGANPLLDLKAVNAQPGGISQQVIKSEFWRLGISQNYLCIDSDAYFIRQFSKDDFLTPMGYPYTVMNESLELRLFGALHGHAKIDRNREVECKAIMDIFGRAGRYYDFGPLPVVWSRLVWSDLADKFLLPQGMNFLDAIKQFPSEMRWYGEALLRFRSIELWPVETLFRCYHYEEQYLAARRNGEEDDRLKTTYMGICRQSNWDKALDHAQARKGTLSRIVRSVRRRVLRHLG